MKNLVERESGSLYVKVHRNENTRPFDTGFPMKAAGINHNVILPIHNQSSYKSLMFEIDRVFPVPVYKITGHTLMF